MLTLDHQGIAARIPHAGRMCLLDEVLEWTAHGIVCTASSHTAVDHPLRSRGRLGAAAGVEYAAQAMAVHGALLNPPDGAPVQGFLASVRSLSVHVDRLDDCAGPLRITAERLQGDERVTVYQFRISHRDRCLLEGRASVVLNAESP